MDKAQSYQTLISTEGLESLISNPNLIVMDCRFALGDTDNRFSDYQHSHIPGARYAHLDDDLSGEIIPGKTGRHPLPDIDRFARTLGNWGIDASKQVVAYDDMGGPFAARLWSMLKWLGHDAVAVLDGGWPKWVDEDRPTDQTIPTVSATRFIPRPLAAFLADANEVEKATTNPDICLIDARATLRYEGKEEPLDPVAGHIPSARSFPWMENLDENNCFLTPATLKKRFSGIDTNQAIAYCGSGVTAAHNLLAIAHAGLPLPRLYAGSWSEWITSPTRIIAISRAV